MFAQFEKILGDGERIDFSIRRQGDRLTVLIQPCFKGPEPAIDDPQLEQVRAALSMPLCVTDTAANLDREFPSSLLQYVGGVSDGKTALSQALSRIKEAGKTATTLAASSTVGEAQSTEATAETRENGTAAVGAHPSTGSKSLF